MYVFGLVAAKKGELKPNQVYEGQFVASTKLDIYDASKHLDDLEFSKYDYFIIEIPNKRKIPSKRIIKAKKIFVLNKLHNLQEKINFDASTKWAQRYLNVNSVSNKTKKLLKDHIKNGPYEDIEIYIQGE